MKFFKIYAGHIENLRKARVGRGFRVSENQNNLLFL